MLQTKKCIRGDRRPNTYYDRNCPRLSWGVAVLPKQTQAQARGAKEDKGEQTLFRDDLRERVAILEEKLEQAYEEKNTVADKTLSKSASKSLPNE